MSQTSQRPASFEFEALEAARNYRKAIVSEFAPFIRGNVLEVGSGIGQTTMILAGLPGVSSVAALEPDPEFCERMRENADLKSVRVLNGNTKLPGLGDEFDAIVNVNVLEHIEDDMDELQRYQSLLAGRGGHLCLFVPAGPRLYSPIDKRFGHFRRYGIRELRDKLCAAGFKIEHLRYFNFPGYFLWWIEFSLLKRQSFNPAKVRIFDRYVFPAVNLAERRLCRPWKGQSLLAVARA